MIAKYIIFQAYGIKGIIDECKFALLSILKNNSDEVLKTIQIIIYTDAKNDFLSFSTHLQLHFEELNSEIIKAYRGDINFVHRVKIEVLLNALQKYQGNFIYMDTDIVLNKSITSLFEMISQTAFLMHINEGKIQKGRNIILSKTRKFLNSSPTYKLGNDTEITIQFPLNMYNAGVLGFSNQHKNLIQNVLELTDGMHPKFPKHIVEQFAFSYFFQTNGKIIESHPYIFHYWNLKEFREELNSFFNQNGTIELQLSNFNKISPILQSTKKHAFYSKPGFLRALLRLIGKGVAK